MAPGPEPVLQWQLSLLGFIFNVRGNSKVPAIGLLQAACGKRKPEFVRGKQKPRGPQSTDSKGEAMRHIAGDGPQV